MEEKNNNWLKYSHSNDSPAEYTKNEVHDEERSKHDHGNEVDELPRRTHGILDLNNHQLAIYVHFALSLHF